MSDRRLEQVARFRELHERPGAFVLPNPWDAGSARMLEALGFEALATTSSGYGYSVGLRDDPAALSREGVLANAHAIIAATPLPVSADLQNGFGDSPEAAAETIRAAAAVGLAGGSIEDATGDPAQPIYEFEHAVARVAAAVEAARDVGFVLTARAEGHLYGAADVNETIRRLQAFADAGADVLYAPGLPGIEAIRSVCANVSKPVNVLAGLGGSTYTVAQLEAAGVKRISLGGAFAKAAYSAFITAAREVKDSGTFTFLGRNLPSGELEAFLRRE